MPSRLQFFSPREIAYYKMGQTHRPAPYDFYLFTHLKPQ